MNTLHIQVSPKGADSASRTVSNYLVNRLKELNKDVKINSRDLAINPLPHVDALTMSAYFTPPENHTAEQKNAIKLSNTLVDELLSNDTIVISTPMWNFSMPSVLKAWIDHVIRAGRTFSFTPEGPKGLLTGKKVYLVVSSGSVFSEGPFAAYDHIIPSLKTALWFVGITDVELIRVEGTNDPTKATEAVSKAKLKIDQFLKF
ncbi:MAG: FMN-dependent NADH-azoreductase [Bacteriovoracaceae bacterium]